MYFLNNEINLKTRFAKEKFIEYDNGYDVLDSYFLKKLNEIPSAGTFRITNQDEINRPDIISYKIYNHVQYWWIIMLFNDIYDETNLPYYTLLEYPSLPDLENLYFELKSKSR
jgi:hypothetical protein